MAVQPFLSVDAGFVELLSSKNFASDNISMVLIPHSFTASINRAGMTYADIKASEAAIIALPTPAVALNGTNVRFTHAKGTFTADGSLTGRYVMYVYGLHSGPPADADKVFGYVDLTGAAEDASSVNAEFSFTPHATNGLFQVARSAGV
jgi:hypothetical protein